MLNHNFYMPFINIFSFLFFYVQIISVCGLRKLSFSDKSPGTMTATSMAAALASAGLNLHVSTVANSREASEPPTASNAGSPENITAATLLAAAAAHAAATAVSTRRTSKDERGKGDDEQNDRQHPDMDRNMEVNVDVDDDIESDKSNAEDFVTNKGFTSPHNVCKPDCYDENVEDPEEIIGKGLSPNEPETSSSSLLNSANKHRRKTRKQDSTKEKY